MRGLKICVIGAGSSYTPELIEGFIARAKTLPLATIALMDIDEQRLSVIGGLAKRMVLNAESGIELTLTTNRREALKGADYVITQIRVGGLACRVQDERIPLRFGVIGQETTGPGGFANALRTIPVLLDIAEDMVDAAPGAHLINFSNPSGIVTEALLNHTVVPAIGLCNSPFGFSQTIAQQLGVVPERIRLDYVGLNHLSWIRGVTLNGQDVFPTVLREAINLAESGETPFSPQLLATLGLLPSYYLRYYYHHDRTLAQQRQAGMTRGEVVQEIDERLLTLYTDPNLVQKPSLLEERGGAHYSTVAVSVIEAIHHNTGQVQIVNTINNGALSDLPENCVVELPSVIDAGGARALPVIPMPPSIRGLTQAVKAYEQLTVQAAVHGDERAALHALLAHPLVPSFDIATGLWAAIKDANRAYLPQFGDRI